MGTVKAAEILVWAKVLGGGYGSSIPFFGFERQGAPVTAFVKLDDKPIRPKTQVYTRIASSSSTRRFKTPSTCSRE